jgi:hypothetical protein
MKKKTIVISRSYARPDHFHAVYKGNGKKIYDITGCEIEGFSLHGTEYPSATLSHVVINRKHGDDGLEYRTKYLKCRSIEFNMEFEEITKEHYNSRMGIK